MGRIVTSRMLYNWIFRREKKGDPSVGLAVPNPLNGGTFTVWREERTADSDVNSRVSSMVYATGVYPYSKPHLPNYGNIVIDAAQMNSADGQCVAYGRGTLKVIRSDHNIEGFNIFILPSRTVRGRGSSVS